MNLELKSWEYYLGLIYEEVTGWSNVLNVVYGNNKLVVAAIFLFLVLFYWLARRRYMKAIKYFRSGDNIQIRKLTGKRSGILSRFDSDNIYFIPNNGYQVVQRKWYWFFFIQNVSLEERER